MYLEPKIFSYKILWQDLLSQDENAHRILLSDLSLIGQVHWVECLKTLFFDCIHLSYHWEICKDFISKEFKFCKLGISLFQSANVVGYACKSVYFAKMSLSGERIGILKKIQGFKLRPW